MSQAALRHNSHWRMLFDEMPYEFLNSASGKCFYDFITAQKNKRTILLITYRQDYIDLADTVIQLHQDMPPQIKEKKHA